MKAAAEADKVIFEGKLNEDRSKTALFKYFGAFRKDNMTRNMTYGETSAENDLQKVNLLQTVSLWCLSNHLSSIFHYNLPNVLRHYFDTTLDTIEISEKDVLIICKDLNTIKSKGLDNLPPILSRKLVYLSLILCVKPIEKSFKRESSLTTGKRQSLFLCSKKGNNSQVYNYRPVSLLNIPWKIFKTLIFKKLYTFCSPFLNDSQFGFRKTRSTITQLIHFLQKIYEGIATNSDIDVLFTDFSKAFDKVDQGYSYRTSTKWEFVKSFFK